ncbi:MAG: carbohydrate porin [bacterium]
MFVNLSGGLHRSGTYLDNVDVVLTLDAEKIFAWNSATAFIYVLGNNGGNPSANSGDIQGISSIAAYNTWQLYEAWIQQNLTAYQLSFLLGLYDLNSEFDVLQSSNFFLNSSHGIDPTFAQSGLNGPSIFPNTTVGLRVKWSPTPSFFFQTIVLNGVAGDPANRHFAHVTLARSHGILSTSEIAFINNPRIEAASAGGLEHHRHIGRLATPACQGKIGVGLWFYTAKFEPLPPPDDAADAKNGGNLGLYFIAEQTVFEEKAEPDQTLEIFTRLGYANPKINRFGFYFGAGAVYTGLIPGRDQDGVGIAAAGLYNGSEFKQAQMNHGIEVDSAEWNIEFSYAARMTPWFELQPDIQYIIHPNTNPAVENALTVGIRSSVTF